MPRSVWDDAGNTGLFRFFFILFQPFDENILRMVGGKNVVKEQKSIDDVVELVKAANELALADSKRCTQHRQKIQISSEKGTDINSLRDKRAKKVASVKVTKSHGSLRQFEGLEQRFSEDLQDYSVHDSEDEDDQQSLKSATEILHPDDRSQPALSVMQQRSSYSGYKTGSAQSTSGVKTGTSSYARAGHSSTSIGSSSTQPQTSRSFVSRDRLPCNYVMEGRACPHDKCGYSHDPDLIAAYVAEKAAYFNNIHKSLDVKGWQERSHKKASGDVVKTPTTVLQRPQSDARHQSDARPQYRLTEQVESSRFQDGSSTSSAHPGQDRQEHGVDD